MPPLSTAAASAFPDSTPRALGRQLVMELQRLPGECDTARCLKLIADGADVEFRGRENNTPLILAAFYGYADIAETLIAKKAALNAVNEHEHTALMLAASLGHLPVVQHLIHAGADLGVKDQNGDTALDRAYAYGSSDAIHLRQRPIISALQAAERQRAQNTARTALNAELEGGLATKNPVKPLKPVQFRRD